MTSKTSKCLIAGCLILSITFVISAQTRPHDRIMKDVAPVFASLKMNIDAKMGAEAATDAMKLAGLFKETEAFWTPLRSRIAIKAAKDMQDLAGKIAAAAIADLSQASALYATAGTTCKTCHDRHRIQLQDGSYRILP